MMYRSANQIIAGQLAHLREKPPIPRLRFRPGFRALEDLDHADDTGLYSEQTQHQKKVGWINGGRFRGNPCRSARLHKSVRAVQEHLLQQRAMRILSPHTVAKPRALQVDLALKFQTPRGVEHPNGAADCRQGLDDVREEKAMEFRRGNVALG